MDVRALFGNIDVYLFDQLLRGNIAPGMRIVDAGCGSGRNLVHFLREGYDVRAVDVDPASVERAQTLAREHAPHLPQDRFRTEALESSSLPAACAHVVICNAVLHFARDDAHFDAMLDGAWRPLSPGGLFFARLASSIGIEDAVVPRGAGRYALPDGSERYLVDEARLVEATARLGGALVDPIKTTNVQGLRCMTTWVVRKAHIGSASTAEPVDPGVRE